MDSSSRGNEHVEGGGQDDGCTEYPGNDQTHILDMHFTHCSSSNDYFEWIWFVLIHTSELCAFVVNKWKCIFILFQI